MVLNVSEVDWPVGEVKIIRIDYETTENCSAAQWLTPEQTVGKVYPYLFTQCQAIHARSLLPCQVKQEIAFSLSLSLSFFRTLLVLRQLIQLKLLYQKL